MIIMNLFETLSAMLLAEYKAASQAPATLKDSLVQDTLERPLPSLHAACRPAPPSPSTPRGQPLLGRQTPEPHHCSPDVFAL